HRRFLSYANSECASLYPAPPFFFFFNYTAPPEIYTLSLHDALPRARRIPGMLVAAGLVASYVCGASFSALPPGWHQSGSGRALIIDGVVPSNTFSWAATPRTVYDLIAGVAFGRASPPPRLRALAERVLRG